MRIVIMTLMLCLTFGCQHSAEHSASNQNLLAQFIGDKASKPVLVDVEGVATLPLGGGHVVILRESDGDRTCPIFIGTLEALNIARQLAGQTTPRPMTYDLIYSILEITDARVRKITVTDLRDNTYFAEVELRRGWRGTHRIDARPSDAIMLAIRTSAPIYINPTIFDKMGDFEPEELERVPPPRRTLPGESGEI